ncbi:MAG TPA: hypothetical protein VLN56_09775, partial [Gammaproteobacteria bacterium]|nr:hypothetical protein [Gammaproteobacteria bacterium]
IHKQHLELRELFMRHQEYLLQEEFENAIEQLEQFNTCLDAHMELEEEHLFPEFARIERKSRWNLDLYETEHVKIRRMHEHIAAELEWLHAESLGASDRRRNIIALLDKEKTYKGMLEHHEDREEDAMLRELDEQLPAERLEELGSKINAGWKKAINQ